MKMRNIFLILAATLAVGGFTSCHRETLEPEPPAFSGEEVRFVLDVPAAATPMTRSMDGAKENEVQEVAVLVFSVDASGNETFDYSKIVPQSAITNSSAPYRIEFKVVLNSGNDKKVALVANPSAVLKTYIASITANTPKTAVLQNLVYSNTSSTGWAADGAGTYTPIPMYGETPKVNIAAGGNISGIQMIRMLARIDVKVNLVVSSLPFILDKIHLCNYNTNGRVSPVWDAKGATSATAATAPNLPTMLAHTTLSIPYTTVPSIGEIYTFEAKAASDANGIAHADRKEATCLVLEGRFNGSATSSFYRVDFTYDGTVTGTTKGDYMPLLRNHNYVVEVTDAQANGYPNLNAALESYSVQSNLAVRTISYDMGVIKDIVFNNNQMMGSNEGSVLFAKSGMQESELYLYSENPWVIKDVIDANTGTTASWCSSLKGQSGVAGLTQKTFTVTANTDEVRLAKVLISSGRLEYTLDLVQDGMITNCYMVKPGESVLIPVAPVYDIWANNTNLGTPIPDGVLTADLHWSKDSKSSGSAIIKSVELQGADKGSKAMIRVEGLPAKIGNAVVAFKVDGDIYWSYHIWITDYDPSVDYVNSPGCGVVMSRNLGAPKDPSFLPGGQESNYSTYGMFYQWGRKDPFVAPTTSYAVLGTERRPEVGVPPRPYFARATTLGQVIREPEVWRAGTSPATWIQYTALSGDYWWSYSQTQKAISDPCPAGWKVSWTHPWCNESGQALGSGAKKVDVKGMWFSNEPATSADYIDCYPYCGALRISDGAVQLVQNTGSLLIACYPWRLSGYDNSGKLNSGVGVPAYSSAPVRCMKK